jgi:acetyl-CoA carboxylase carboxyl transferase subunit beta
MSWFRRDRYTKLNPPERKMRIPEGIWHKCEKCDSIYPKQDYERNFHCCIACGAPWENQRGEAA